MIDDHRTLPGYPRKSLVLKVRKALNRYGIRPYAPAVSLNQIWRDAWTWADDCRSNDYGKGKSLKSFWKLRPKKWPTPNEIASQYVYLLLATMRNDIALRLPFEARALPPSIAAAYAMPDYLRKERAKQRHLRDEMDMPLLPAD